MRVQDELQVYVETAAQHSSSAVQQFISGEITRPCKQWVQDVIENRKECDTLQLRTPEFILLPDTNSRRSAAPAFLMNRNSGTSSGLNYPLRKMPSLVQVETEKQPKYFLNWLSIVCDRQIRTIRDLRAEHVPMLVSMQKQCLGAIKQAFDVTDTDILIFANYPPSVYQLHFHWCCVASRMTSYDALRMHSLTSIIDNLSKDSMYYATARLQVPLYKDSLLYNVLHGSKGPEKVYEIEYGDGPRAVRERRGSGRVEALVSGGVETLVAGGVETLVSRGVDTKVSGVAEDKNNPEENCVPESVIVSVGALHISERGLYDTGEKSMTNLMEADSVAV